ncbi:hypothetical protein HW555_005934 [Spodoptera exigua]|uniref:Uncharacterized protein n=1 Tax=Spodoptera exigua TaxID=7107 RepID=A0A835GJK9_SPOEX|nr:hypothetical protein HW555_005934 [Spodoptera exigua]
MKFFIFTIFCNLLSLGYLQETYKEDDGYRFSPVEVDKSPGSEWPVKTYNNVGRNNYDQIEGTSLQKPCTRRSNSGDDPLSSPLPTYKEKHMTTIISPATPKHEPKVSRKKPYDLKVADNQDLHPKTILPDDSAHKSRNLITISNPLIDSLEENHRQLLIKDADDATPEPLPVHSLHPTQPSALVPNITDNHPDQSPYENSYPPKAVPKSWPVHYVPNTGYENQYFPTPITTQTKPKYNPLLASKHNPLKTYNSLLGPVANSEPEVAPTPVNKCTQDKKDDDLEHSRRSMSNHNDGENVPNNKPYVQYAESKTDNENAMAYVLNLEKSSSENDVEVPQEKNRVLLEKTETHVGRAQYKEARRNEVMEPTKGDGVVNMGESSLMLMQTDRLCYACSTANNPSCWAPDRRTTVKYCRKENNACITKTFGKGSTYTLIRDCGNTCDDSDTGMLMPKYKSCSMCHTDLCNGAYSINGHSIIFALTLIALVKYLN